MGLPKVQIDVISDNICPWCFVGKRRLEKAMSKFAGRAEFEVIWHPYQLQPDSSLTGTNKLAMYNEKFGRDRVLQMIPAMEKNFADEGLQYKIGGLTGNTLDSHRLMAWAGKQGPAAQNALVEEIMLDYFTRERFINDREVLLAAVERAGLATEGAAAVLDSTAELTNVQSEVADASRHISGVPFFTISNQWQVSGAQTPDVFEDLISKAIAASA